MLFVATCIDKPSSLETRKENRPAHLAYLEELGPRVKIAGALLGADLQTPIGSMLIFEGETEHEIRGILGQDPYFLAGLFESVGVRPWRQAVGQSLA